MARFGLSERFQVAAVRARRARREAASRVLASPLLRWRYATGEARSLLIVPQDVRSRDPSFWPEVESGYLGLAGGVVDITERSPFDTMAPGRAWIEALHGFSWLRHIEVAADDGAEAWARDTVLDWLDRMAAHPEVALSPRVRARRVISWLSAASVLIDDDETDKADAFLGGLFREIAALSASWRNAGEGAGRLTALTALLLARLASDDEQRHIEATAALLSVEIDRQVLPDGGHVSRDPTALIDVLLDWLPLKTCFDARGLPVPRALGSGIERALGMLRYLRLGDGGISRFNGMGIADPGALATLMGYDEKPVPAWPVAPSSRYVRLAAAQTIVIADAGAPPALDISGSACAGTLAFEMSAGTQLVFVNMGTPGLPDSDWRMMARATASHTTACLAETSSAQLVRHPSLSHMADAPALALTGTVRASVTRDDTDAQTLDASHEGYLGRLGLVHRRTLRLAAGGDRLDGVDRFEPARRGAGGDEVGFAIHFHVHPAVSVELLAEGSGSRRGRIVLGLPDGSRWRFEAEGVRVTIEESTFLAGSSGPRPSLQIVLSGLAIRGAEVTWSVALHGRDDSRSATPDNDTTDDTETEHVPPEDEEQ